MFDLSNSNPFRYMLNPANKALFSRLDTMAATADYDSDVLDEIRRIPELQKDKAALYYLASLYLQIEENIAASDLLASISKPAPVMKKYYQVLSYSRRQKLNLPKLTAEETGCIEYLDRVINPDHSSIEKKILSDGGFAIVGNAPGPDSGPDSGPGSRKGSGLRSPVDSCKFYFNSYRKNTRITDEASIHVVTPSWQTDVVENTNCLCITGNSIFHRRSKVWKKFTGNRGFSAIYTLPRSLWRTLYTELGASPSAGLLIVALVAEIAARRPDQLNGYIAGFTLPWLNCTPANSVNHSYDSEPASIRHNWNAEAVVLKRLITQLESDCCDLTVEP